MLDRETRSAWLSYIRAVIPLFLLGSVPAGVRPALAADQEIHFHELAAYARDTSPRARILVDELRALRAERDMALQWTNPEIAYDREDVHTAREHQIRLNKTVTLPWTRAKHRAAWDLQMQSAEVAVEASAAELQAELETGYVRLRLLERWIEELQRQHAAALRVAEIAAARRDEGEISGAEQTLIELSVFSLEAKRRTVLRERNELAARWRAVLGIPRFDSVELATPVAFTPVDLGGADSFLESLAEHPGIRSRSLLRDALERRASAARSAAFPVLDLYAGYKRIEPSHDGYVAGIGLTLPIFDRGQAAARKYQAERSRVEGDLALYRSHTAGEIDALVRSIESIRDLLASETGRVPDAPVVDDLALAYEEGFLSLEALLEGIQIESSALESYFDQLTDYYTDIFRLEAITGMEIVSIGR